MEREILFEMKSPYRDDFRIHGFSFGTGSPKVAVVGALRGDEIQQQYICARLVKKLKALETQGCLKDSGSILVIPSCNPFSMNVSRRFWTMDGTDINRMFPGYDQGETTQRIAAAIFNKLQGFDYGIQLASFYMPGDFVPHVRMLKTGYEDVDGARLFGLPFVTLRQPRPFDTTLLNYNWQLWNVKAYSLYAGQTNYVEDGTSRQTLTGILRFLARIGVIDYEERVAGYNPVVFDEKELVNVTAAHAGIFHVLKKAGEEVVEGETMARILDPYDCTVLDDVKSPVNGTIFFSHNKPLALQHAIMYRIRRDIF